MTITRPKIPSHDDMTKGFHILMAEIAIEMEDFSEAASCYQQAATLNANLGRYAKAEDYQRLAKHFQDLAQTFDRSH